MTGTAFLASMLLARATLLLVAGAGVVLVLRRASAAARHAAWAFTMAALLFLPALVRVVPRLELAVLSGPPTAASPTIVEIAPQPEAARDVRFAEVAPHVPASVGVSAVRTAIGPSIAGALTRLWMAGVVVALAQLFVGAVLVWRVVRRARPVDAAIWDALLAEARSRLGITRPIVLRQDAAVAVAMVWGHRRPVVLLPPSADEWPRDRKQAFLMHELAHVRRHDWLVQVVAHVTRALYWPHPLVWWAVRGLRREAERACDDRVLGTGTGGTDYAHHLLEAARSLRQAPHPIAVVAVAERSTFEDRLLALLDPGISRRPLTWRTFALGVAATAVVAGSAAALQPVARAVLASALERAPIAEDVPVPAAGDAPVARAAPTTSLRFQGMVTDPDGTPVVGARITVWAEPVSRGAAPARTETNAGGRFELMLPRAATSVGLLVDSPSWPAVRLDERPTGAPITVTLNRGETLEGTVRDGSTKDPIEGAQVSARALDVGREAGPGPEARATRTDAGGRFQLQGVNAGRHRIVASARRYGRAEAEGRTGTPTDVVLGPGAVLTGRIRGADDRAVAGARVEVQSLPPKAAEFEFPTATTDAEGRFEIVGLEAGTYRVRAANDTMGTAVARVDVVSETTIDLRLEPAVEVRGRLVGSDGKPIRGSVSVQALDGFVLREPQVATADERGRFILASMPQGRHTIVAAAAGFARRPVEVNVSVAGQAARMDVGDVQLAPGLQIRGVVRDRDGAPIRGAAVVSGLATDARAETDARGAFVLAGVESDSTHLTVRAPRFATQRLLVSPHESPVEVRLERGAGLVVRVLDDRGEPLNRGILLVRKPLESGSSGGEARRAQGVLERSDLAAGAYDVQVACLGWLAHRFENVVLRSGETRDLGEVRLSRGRVVTGVVLDEDEKPISAASVSAGSREGFWVSPALTDGAGRFTLSGLPATGAMSMWASHPQHGVSKTTSTPFAEGASSDIRLVLQRGGRIVGSVRRARSEGLGEAFVRLSRPEAGHRDVTVGADGGFTIEHVPPGEARLTLFVGASGDYRGTAGRAVTVEAGRETNVDFLVRRVRVSGVVTRAGQPVGDRLVSMSGSGVGQTVRLRPGASGSSFHPVTTAVNPDGTYAIVLPSPGRYTLSVESNPIGGRSDTESWVTLEVPDVDELRQDFQLPHALLTGRVLAAGTEQPIAQARVRAAGADGVWLSAWTDADGRFRLAADSGKRTVRVEAPEHATVTDTIEIEGSIEKTFHLPRARTLEGRVTLPSGEPATSGWALAVSDDGQHTSGRGLQDGAFAIGGLPPGRYRILVASRVGFAAAEGGVPGGPPMDLKMSTGGRVRLEIKGADGEPLAYTAVRISLLRRNDQTMGLEGVTTYSQTPTTDGRGIAEVDLPDGALELATAETISKRRGAVRLDVRPGGATTASVVLHGPGTP